MNVQQLAETICAVHLAHYVDGTLDQRGGVFFIAPPGSLKSVMVEVLSTYYDALILTDINVQSLVDLRDTMVGGGISSLVFPEYPKIYERHLYTAANIEGSLRALASEGFAAASFQDSRIARRKAYATIIGAMPPVTLDKHFKRWEESGFNRRFLWALYSLRGTEILIDAAANLSRLDFGVTELPRVPPLGKSIPALLTPDEKYQVKLWVRWQPGGSHVQQIQILTRMFSVLKWWHRERGDPKAATDTMHAFSLALSKDGTELDLRPTESLNGKRRHVKPSEREPDRVRAANLESTQDGAKPSDKSG